PTLPFLFFFFNAPPTSYIYTLSLHDALPILVEHPPLHPGRVLHPDRHLREQALEDARRGEIIGRPDLAHVGHDGLRRHARDRAEDRKSTRLNSSHSQISYAVFCLKKKKKKKK